MYRQNTGAQQVICLQVGQGNIDGIPLIEATHVSGEISQSVILADDARAEIRLDGHGGSVFRFLHHHFQIGDGVIADPA